MLRPLESGAIRHGTVSGMSPRGKGTDMPKVFKGIPRTAATVAIPARDPRRARFLFTGGHLELLSLLLLPCSPHFRGCCGPSHRLWS